MRNKGERASRELRFSYFNSSSRTSLTRPKLTLATFKQNKKSLAEGGEEASVWVIVVPTQMLKAGVRKSYSSNLSRLRLI